MDTAFDYVLYNKYISDILALMDDLNDPDIFTKLYNKTIPILNLLDVAFMSNEYAEQAREAGLKISEFALPPKMELGQANTNCVVDIYPKVSDMVSIRLYAHPFADRPEWDDERKEIVRGFISLYFNLIARVRVLRMFESRIFQDPVYPFVGNLAALMRNLGKLRGMGKLEGYTIYRMNIYKYARINRIFGRDAGDKIMAEYIHKLITINGPFGGVYRLGGDNFFGLVPNEMAFVVQKFFEGYTFSGDDKGYEVELQSRAGFYQIWDNSETNDIIISRANSTFAKTTAKNKIRFFDINEEKLEEERSLVEGEFLQAMKDGDVVAYYQPKVDAQNNQIVGVEALCRWIKGDKVITPFVFIPALEVNNQICNLDFYMLRKVCEDLSVWLGKGHEAVRVSVNFSRNNLADKNFVTKVVDVIDEYSIPRDKITVELTETTLENDFDEIKRVVEGFKSYGVKVAVDDFGKGYSSLNLIKDVNWDIIKIDKSFVPAQNSKSYDKSINMLGSVIQMANNVGMLTVVEGVETLDQVELVKNAGCKVIQGYYFDKPLPKEEFEAKMLGAYDGECKWHS